MSELILAERSETKLPLTLTVSQNGGLSGLTSTVALRDGQTDDSYLDFNDVTFKTGGWGTQKAALSDEGGGLYLFTGGLDLTAITNLPATTHHLVAEFETAGGGLSGIDHDIIVLGEDFYAIGDDVWIKDISANSFWGSQAGGMLNLLRKGMTNQLNLTGGSPGKLELYDDNNSTIILTWEETDAASGGIVLRVGAPARRAKAT